MQGLGHREHLCADEDEVWRWYSIVCTILQLHDRLLGQNFVVLSSARWLAQDGQGNCGALVDVNRDARVGCRELQGALAERVREFTPRMWFERDVATLTLHPWF